MNIELIISLINLLVSFICLSIEYNNDGITWEFFVWLLIVLTDLWVANKRRNK